MVGNCFEDHSQATIDHGRCDISTQQSATWDCFKFACSRRCFSLTDVRWTPHRFLPYPLKFSSTPTYFILSFNSAFIPPHSPTTSRITHTSRTCCDSVTRFGLYSLVRVSETVLLKDTRSSISGESGSPMVKFDHFVVSGVQDQTAIVIERIDPDDPITWLTFES